ncbi:MAG: flagellar protein FliS [Sphingomonadaceae bacterium]|nr:flagellar protein FliS [Sphingomonadaceae bacterium]
MLTSNSPSEAYRRVDFDARVEGSDPGKLVTLCYEQLTSALGTALYAHDRGDNQLKSQSMTRALSAITLLQLGVNGDESVTSALNHLFKAARKSILDCALKFDAKVIGSIRKDFAEISRAMTAAH